MTAPSFSSYAKATCTASPGSMVAQPSAPRLSDEQQTKLARLIDLRREHDAVSAGLSLEIAMMLGDRDGAQRARKEMEAQIGARRAVRESGCFFDQVGELDAGRFA